MTEKPKDYALMGPPTQDGRIAIVCNQSEKKIEVGEFRPVPKGKPLNMFNGDIVRLTPRKNDPRMDFEYIYKQPHQAAPESQEEPADNNQGPAMVASEAYRDGWEAIWGKPIGSA